MKIDVYLIDGRNIYLRCLKIDVYLIDEENYICDMISAFRSATTSVIFEVINPCALKKGKKQKKVLDLSLDPKKVYMDSIWGLCFSLDL